MKLFTSLLLIFALLGIGYLFYGQNDTYRDPYEHPKNEGYGKIVYPLRGSIGDRISSELGLRCVGIGGAMNHDDCTIKYSTLGFSLWERKTPDEARLLLLKALEIGMDEYRKADGLDPYIRDDFGVENLDFSIIFSENLTDPQVYPNLTTISFINGEFVYSWWDEGWNKGSDSEDKEEKEPLEEAIKKSGMQFDLEFRKHK